MSDCVKCGAAVAADAKFCSSCGSKLERAAPEALISGEPQAALLGGDKAPAGPPTHLGVSANRGSSRRLPIAAAAIAVIASAGLYLTLQTADDASGKKQDWPLTVQESPRIPPDIPVPPSVSTPTPVRPIARPAARVDMKEDPRDRPVVAVAPPQKPAPHPEPSKIAVEPAETAPRDAPATPARVRSPRDTGITADARRLQEDATRSGSQQPVRGDRRLARQLNARGLELSREGRHSDAAAQFRQAREADGSDPEIRENLGYALLKAGRLPEAESALKSAVEIAPRRATAWGSLGFVHAKTGRHDEGVKLMLAALRVAPDPQRTLATYARQAKTESDPRVRAMLADVVSGAGNVQ